MVGFYLGSLGELEVPSSAGFKVIDAKSGNVVHEGQLAARPDKGYTFTPTPYQKVFTADFSNFNTPGEYRLLVPGLGTSYSFRIDEGLAALYARTYALGLYHQRCGTNNVLPFTRHVHDVCHAAPADVPNSSFSAVNNALANFSAEVTRALSCDRTCPLTAGVFPLSMPISRSRSFCWSAWLR